MTQRQNIFSGTVWEDVAGFARAVRIGNLVFVSGTTATDSNGNIVGENDPYAQTVFIIQKIERALQEAGASLRDVARTRIFVADVNQWEVVAKAHGEFFRDIRPANTLVEVSNLVGEGYLVEMEADAVIQEHP
jgi:enamine deaminase RidA (YjgF/YER057c/UK114 family)